MPNGPSSGGPHLAPRPTGGSAQERTGSATVLSLKVVTGGHVMTIAITGQEVVAAVTEWRPASLGSTEGVVRVEHRLYPGRRLRSPQAPVGGPDGLGRWAILVPQPDGSRYALVVDQVIGLEPLAQSRVFTVGHSGSARGTWFAGDGPITQVFQVNSLVEGTAGADVLGSQPGQDDGRDSVETALGTLTMRLQFEGIRISCGTIECVIPFGIARSAISLRVEARLAPRASAANLIPVVDATALLDRAAPAAPWHCVLLSLPGQELVVLTADKLRLEPYADGNEWLSLPPISNVLSALFDAVRLDPVSRCWLLRIRADIASECLPRAARVAIGRAIAGWTSA